MQSLLKVIDIYKCRINSSEVPSVVLIPSLSKKASQILRVGHANNKGKKEESMVQNLRT